VTEQWFMALHADRELQAHLECAAGDGHIGNGMIARETQRIAGFVHQEDAHRAEVAVGQTEVGYITADIGGVGDRVAQFVGEGLCGREIATGDCERNMRMAQTKLLRGFAARDPVAANEENWLHRAIP